LRIGKVPGQTLSHGAKMLRLRNSLTNLRVVRKFSTEIYTQHPRAPITGTTLGERRGQETIIIEIEQLVEKKKLTFRYIEIKPPPEPISLYQPRVYELFAPKSIPMPEPSYKSQPEIATPNLYISESHPTAWLERLISRVARDAISQTDLIIKTLSPIAGIESLKRTKYPPPLTIKFATFGRKPTKNNMAMGGLSAELIVSELVTTYVPPQYGHFTMMDRGSIVRRRSAREDERSVAHTRRDNHAAYSNRSRFLIDRRHVASDICCR